MTKIEIGGIVALVVAVATAAVFIGALRERVSILETAVGVLNGQVTTLKQLDLKGTKQRLEEVITRSYLINA